MLREIEFDGEEISMEILNRENPRLIKKDVEHQIIWHALRGRNQKLYSELGSRDWRH